MKLRFKPNGWTNVTALTVGKVYDVIRIQESAMRVRVRNDSGDLGWYQLKHFQPVGEANLGRVRV